MAAETRSTRQALLDANTRLTLLQTDPRLDSAGQALAGELIQANTLAINAMNAQDIIPGGQRSARAQQIEDKVFANATVQRAHNADISIDEYYNALDLSQDAAGAIRIGSGTFTSDISVAV